MAIQEQDATSVAKRITRKICLVKNLHWHQLLQYEEEVCRPEDSWSYRSWISFLLRLGMNEEQIFDLAVRRIQEIKANDALRSNCALLVA